MISIKKHIKFIFTNSIEPHYIKEIHHRVSVWQPQPQVVHYVAVFVVSAAVVTFHWPPFS